MSITKSSGTIKIGENDFNYDLVRVPRRKSLRIKVISHNRIELRCAKNVKWGVISDFVHSKENWIKDRIQILVDSTFLCFPDNFENQQILFKGEYLKLKLSHQALNKYAIKLTDKEILITAPIGSLNRNIKRKLEEFYKSQLLSLVDDWISNLDAKHKPSKVIIRNYKSKWGSTNSNREIYLNTFLLMIPEYLIEYVYYHEISHLTELNHSKKYKQILGNFLPDYQVRQKKLKNYRLTK